MRKNTNNFVNGETTVIGAGTVVEGTLVLNASARVDGTVNGDVISQSTVIIGAEGIVNGNITTVNLMIAGKIKGNVTASGKIEVVAKGRLDGDIKTGSLIIDEAATFQGKCIMENETAEPILENN